MESEMNVQKILNKINSDLEENRKMQAARKSIGRTNNALMVQENRLCDLHFYLTKNEAYLNAILPSLSLENTAPVSDPGRGGAQGEQ